MGQGTQEAKKLIAQLRAKTYRKLNDNELLEFRKEMVDHMGGTLNEAISENVIDKHFEGILDGLKLSFQTAYEKGLESAGSYDDFDKEYWNRYKPDLLDALKKALKGRGI
tara:strand:- start:13534 stop:13863 length:330 start_codon:yes stop_codon:yes gene_type:complete